MVEEKSFITQNTSAFINDNDEKKVTFEDEHLTVSLKRYIMDKSTKNSPNIRLQSDPLRRAELKLIESQIENLAALPDFGYGADNYILDREKP